MKTHLLALTSAFLRLNYPADYLTLIDLDNELRFLAFTRTDFSWAMQANPVLFPAAPKSSAAA